MLVALKNWRSRLLGVDHSEIDALAQMAEFTRTRSGATYCDLVLRRFCAVRSANPAIDTETGLGPQFSGATALSSFEGREIFNSALRRAPHSEGDT